jgi:hypothetical protein
MRPRQYPFLAILLTMLAIFSYGQYRFPDAPIQKCGSAYCGKQGQPHTKKEFEDFELWETTLMWSWPLGFLALFLLREKKQ